MARYDKRMENYFIQSVLTQTSFFKKTSNFYELFNQIYDNIWAPSKKIIYKNKIVFIGPALISTAMDNVRTIESIMKLGDIVSAFLLVRKIRDELFEYLYFISIANEYENSLSKTAENTQLLGDEKIVFDWINDSKKLSNNEKNKISYAKIKDALSKNGSITKPIVDEYNDYLNKNTKTLNDYVHGYKSGLSDNRIFKVDPKAFQEVSNTFIELLSQIIQFFVCCLFVLDSSELESRDYVDEEEFGFYCEEEKYQLIYPAYHILNDVKKQKPGVFEYLSKNNQNSLCLP
jgi:hypothetical protein